MNNLECEMSQQGFYNFLEPLVFSSAHIIILFYKYLLYPLAGSPTIIFTFHQIFIHVFIIYWLLTSSYWERYEN